MQSAKDNHILFLCDFSEASLNAFSYLIALADTTHFSIHILNVQNFPLGDSVMLANFSRQSPIQIESSLIRLEKLVDPYLSTHAITYSAEFGQVAISVDEYCERNKVSAVVMGSKKKDDFMVNVFGSNTFSLINEAKYPLLLIPLNSIFNHPLRLGYASDLRPGEENFFSKIKHLFKDTIQSFHWIHITERPIIHPNEKVSEVLLSAESYFANCSAEILESDNVLFELDNFVQAQSIDLIVFRKQFRSFMDRIVKPSTTRKFSFRSNIPILILPE
jgi:nucleotide-binding universal stress UspA family protein